MINCIVVDDEELAQNVLEKYIHSIPWLTLKAKCDNAIDALSYLRQNNVDLMFLDIRMPELSGLKLLETMTVAPKVILTTAYSEYALESYEYTVVDYLLKPIEFDRFLKAVNKAAKLIELENKPVEEKEETNTAKSIFIYQDKVSHKVETADIKYLQAQGNYIRVFTTNQTFVTRQTMLEFEKQLNEMEFIRVHKSYIVNKNRIDKVYGNTIVIDDQKIPIGTSYKMTVLKSLK